MDDAHFTFITALIYGRSYSLIQRHAIIIPSQFQWGRTIILWLNYIITAPFTYLQSKMGQKSKCPILLHYILNYVW